MKYADAMVWASGHYLTAHFPANWEDMGAEALEEFLIEHTWEPFEGYPLTTVFNNIENLAHDVMRLFSEESK